MLTNPFRHLFSRGSSKLRGDSTSNIKVQYTSTGLQLPFSQPISEDSIEAFAAYVDSVGQDDGILCAYLSQLIAEGHATLTREFVQISWECVYTLSRSEEHAGAFAWLSVPLECGLRPLLSSDGTLSDSSFKVKVSAWVLNGSSVVPEEVRGAVVKISGEDRLLPEPAWKMLEEIRALDELTFEKKSQTKNELAWGRIRAYADKVGAYYESPYLETTIVLTPESLRLPTVQQETPFGRVHVVEPTFEGAPAEWLKAFDGFNSVQPHYDLTKGRGRIRIILPENVQKVLSVIKQEMPARRIAGRKAEQFIRNPWAVLGEAAHEVIKEEDFIEDRVASGIANSTFSLLIHEKNGRVRGVELAVTQHYADGRSSSFSYQFESPGALRRFLHALKSGLEEEREFFAWDEFDISIDADSARQLEIGLHTAHLWENQPAERINLDDIYILDNYSGRIEGIGTAKPIYVPVFQGKKKDESDPGWVPEDLEPAVMVSLPGSDAKVFVPLSNDWVADFEKQVQEAEKSGANEVRNELLPSALPTSGARDLLNCFHAMLKAQDRVKVDGVGEKKESAVSKDTLLVKTNFHSVEYAEGKAEQRRAALTMPNDFKMHRPSCLRSGVDMKAHQQHGIAWFQHLVSLNSLDCRGALLADDMGLGKTLQLLSVLAWFYENQPSAAPSIIFAPKSLVENWSKEIEKFFTPSFPNVLVLYGEGLRERRQPLELIDEQLKQRKIVDLLKPNWTGNAKVIITTYEVLTSFEFSFAKQLFSFVICDESQRIKNPGALVTMAIKKLKSTFRVACTGTPVENSLADLWCLFDFVQPGLLGALEVFGKTYRRPIECETEEQQSQLEQLQRLIAPQTLRRTKADIAGDLPKKLFAHQSLGSQTIEFKSFLNEHERLELALTPHQSSLYKAGLKKLQDAASETDGRKRAKLSFGALHFMKAVCAEPYCLPGTKFLVDSGGEALHLSNSPKLAWLLSQLKIVQQKNEKAIIFTELREAQAALFYFLKRTFSIKPYIINGDSEGRQGYIDRFSQTSGFDVIILSTIAAGAGLNVTAANHVFHFTRAWNPAKESQATDRAYRIGQSKDVLVYSPVLVAPDFKTFEVRLDELLKRKASLAGATLDGSNIRTMLNGTGGDSSFTEFVRDGGTGVELPTTRITMDFVDRLDGFGFEVFCCLLWDKRGYQSFVTAKKGGDAGVDVVAFKDGAGELLQCKCSINPQVGWDAVKEVTTGAAKYQKQYAGTPLRRIAVTNQSFTSGAVEHAQLNNVELVSRIQIEAYLNAYPTTNHEFDTALQEWNSKI